MLRFRGCTMFWTRVILQMVSLKIIVFSMKTPLRDSNMAAGFRSQWKHLEFTLALSKRFFSLLNLKTFAWALLSIGYSELENTRRIDIFVHVACYPETMPVSRIVKKTQCYIFKIKQSTVLKTGQQTYV